MDNNMLTAFYGFPVICEPPLQSLELPLPLLACLKHSRQLSIGS